MAIYKKTLKDKDGNIIIPVTQAPIIDVTSIDPGEGSPLAENHFLAVYGDTLQAQTEDIADGAVSSDKIKSVVLYENSTGTITGTLSQDAGNFRYIKAQLGKSTAKSTWAEAFVETDGTAGATFCYNHITTFTQIFTGKVSFWDTNFGIYDCRYNNFYGRNDFETGTSTEVRVYKIIGYI